MNQLNLILQRILPYLNPKRAWPYRGYIVLGLASFLLFFYVGFPIEKAQPIIERELTSALKRGLRREVTVELHDLSTYWFSGVSVDRVDVQVDQGDGPPLPVRLENLTLRLNLLPLVFQFGRISISTYVDFFGGHVSATFWKQGDWTSIDSLVSKVSLRKLSVLMADRLMGAKLEGDLDLNVDVEWHEKEPKLSSGTASVTVLKPVIDQGRILFFDIPRIELGQIALATEIKNGSATITRGQIEGDPIRGSFSGGIELDQQFRRSNADITAKLAFSDTLLTQLPQLNGLLGMRRKDDSGFYTFPMKGRLYSLLPGML